MCVCVAVKGFRCPDSGVCAHFEGPINTIGLIGFKLKWKTCFDLSVKNICTKCGSHVFSVFVACALIPAAAHRPPAGGLFRTMRTRLIVGGSCYARC